MTDDDVVDVYVYVCVCVGGGGGGGRRAELLSIHKIPKPKHKYFNFILFQV